MRGLGSDDMLILRDRPLHGADGEVLGTVHGFLIDDQGAVQYLEVRSGFLGTRRHAVPVAGIGQDGDALVCPYTSAQMRDAPSFDEGEVVDFDAESQLAAHYGHGVRPWDDTRDRWLEGEDLSRGPTPATRHPEGGRDALPDTTQGPTPETRHAVRESKDEGPAAAWEPAADPETRAPGLGDDGVGATEEPPAPAPEPMFLRVRLRRWTSTDDA